MSDYDRSSTTTVRETTAGGGLYVVVGALVVAVLVGAYVLIGTPGLHTQVAKAPVGQAIDVTVEQADKPAPANQDSAGPAPWR